MEETKKTALEAGGRLQHDLHQAIFQKFQEAHQGYVAFNVITEKAGIHSILQAHEENYMKVDAALKKTQEKLTRMKRLKWYILDPQSTQVQIWDGFTALALIYTALVTPFEVGFLGAPTSALEPLFVVNRLIDAIFLFDMCLQPFIMFRRAGGEEDYNNLKHFLKQIRGKN